MRMMLWSGVLNPQGAALLPQALAVSAAGVPRYLKPQIRHTRRQKPADQHERLNATTHVVVPQTICISRPGSHAESDRVGGSERRVTGGGGNGGNDVEGLVHDRLVLGHAKGGVVVRPGLQERRLPASGTGR